MANGGKSESSLDHRLRSIILNRLEMVNKSLDFQHHVYSKLSHAVLDSVWLITAPLEMADAQSYSV